MNYCRVCLLLISSFYFVAPDYAWSQTIEREINVPLQFEETDFDEFGDIKTKITPLVQRIESVNYYIKNDIGETYESSLSLVSTAAQFAQSTVLSAAAYSETIVKLINVTRDDSFDELSTTQQMNKIAGALGTVTSNVDSYTKAVDTAYEQMRIELAKSISEVNADQIVRDAQNYRFVAKVSQRARDSMGENINIINDRKVELDSLVDNLNTMVATLNTKEREVRNDAQELLRQGNELAAQYLQANVFSSGLEALYGIPNVAIILQHNAQIVKNDADSLLKRRVKIEVLIGIVGQYLTDLLNVQGVYDSALLESMESSDWNISMVLVDEAVIEGWPRVTEITFEPSRISDSNVAGYELEREFALGVLSFRNLETFSPAYDSNTLEILVCPFIRPDQGYLFNEPGGGAFYCLYEPYTDRIIRTGVFMTEEYLNGLTNLSVKFNVERIVVDPFNGDEYLTTAQVGPYNIEYTVTPNDENDDCGVSKDKANWLDEGQFEFLICEKETKSFEVIANYSSPLKIVDFKEIIRDDRIDQVDISGIAVNNSVLEVINGSGSGTYAMAELVAIEADTVDGGVFSNWVSPLGGDVLGDDSARLTTVSLDAAYTKVEAIYSSDYVAYELVVENGVGSGNYLDDSVVYVSADSRPFVEFLRWEGDVARLDDQYKESTFLKMDTQSIYLKAVYQEPASDVDAITSLMAIYSDGLDALDMCADETSQSVGTGPFYVFQDGGYCRTFADANMIAGDCIDDDGDGWGWNGVESCRISDVLCYDSDGDGWGWTGDTSCRIPPYPDSDRHECVDPDGDGYGWDGLRTCVP